MFKITMGRGFQITFENGWTASVQFGEGNYCSNRFNKEVTESSSRGWCESVSAEIAAFRDINGRREWYGFPQEDSEPASEKGWCSPKEVLEFLNMIASKEKI